MSEYRLVVPAFGGADLIERVAFETQAPGPGQARVRHKAIGVNFIDVYHRTGLYPQPLPAGLGVEGAGVVEAIGEGVTGVQVGDRVGYVARTPGSYATSALIDAEQLIPLPDAVSDEQAAGALLKGLTAEALIFRCAKIEAGQSALVLAAAGGVGQILTRWLSAIGVQVIAHAGSAEKAQLARTAGAAVALHSDFGALAGDVRAATGGEGVHVSFDGVGAASWDASLASLRRRGLLVSFGNASGPVAPFTPLDLSRNGSLFVTRPTLFDYIVTAQERRDGAARLFGAIAAGEVEIAVAQRFGLADAAEAHRALEGRRTTGSTILIP